MISLIWVAAIWAGVLMLTRSDSSEQGENRLHVALALGIVATAAVTESTVESLTSDPVQIERVLRGGLVGASLVLTVPVLLKRIDTALDRPLPTYSVLCAYGFVAVVSVAYSVAPLVTAGKALELSAGLLAVLGVVVLPSPSAAIKRTIRMVVYAVGATTTVALIGYFVLPDIFSIYDTRPGFLTDRTLISPYSHPNGLSFGGALFASYMFAGWIGKHGSFKVRSSQVLGIIAGVATVVLSSGRQGLLILLFSILVILVVSRPRSLSLLILPVVVVIVITAGETIVHTFSRGQSNELLFSLSGRTRWWSSALDTWLEQPALGYGYGAGGRFVALARIGADDVSSVHSGYLEALAGLGLAGFLPLIFVMARVARFAIRVIRVELEYAILVVPITLHTLISLGVGGWWSVDLAILALLAGLADVWRGDVRLDSGKAPLAISDVPSPS